MKTREDIERRIRQLMWFQQAGFTKGSQAWQSQAWYEVCMQINELRWVLGEMEQSSVAALIEHEPNQREPAAPSFYCESHVTDL